MPATAININEARTLANIARRAATLWTDGYTMQDCCLTGCYYVTSPEGAVYLVCADTIADPACDCPCFAQRNTCKHLLAVTDLLKEQAMIAVYEAEQGNDDDRYPEL